MRYHTKIVTFVSMLVLGGCGAFYSSPSYPELTIKVNQGPRERMSVDLERESQSLHSYLKAELALVDQDYEEAMEYLEESARLSRQPEAKLHAKLANLYVREGELEKALAEIQKSLQIDPNDANTLFLYGGVLESLDRQDESIEVYKQLIERNPDNFESHVLLSSLYVKRKEFDKSITLLKKYSSSHPHDPLPVYYIGHVYELDDKLDLAEKYYLKAFDKDPRNAQAIRSLFRLYFKANNLAQLQKFCMDVIVKDPTNIAARRILSQIFLGTGKFEEALEQLQVLESVEREPLQTRLKIATIHIEQQKFSEAIKEIQLILAKYPKHGEALYYLATAYAGLGEKEKALASALEVGDDMSIFVRARMFAAFLARQQDMHEDAERYVREALEKEPDNSKAFAYLLLILRTQEKFDEALSVLKERAETKPDDEYVWYQYAVVLQALGREDDALEKMERVIEINGKNTDALNFVAYALAEKGEDLDRALEMIQQALSVKPADPFYLDTLGWIYYQQGEYELAYRELKKAVEGAPKDIVVMEHLADVLVKLSRPAQAIKVYRDALTIVQEDEADSELLETKQRVKQKLVSLERKHRPKQ